ncbi:cytochrome c oxidase subunit II [Leptolyngbya ohadii]|uniref:cytochrome c oxidase subunit II n=1 Tax=Leptolyngbya ohadii TaxID=1962290 RepID=UPI000B598B9A|nr:cytochrome c oxidase subunit II [Leptolyngbya ohadii]
MKQIPASLLTLVAGVLITLVSLWVGQHHGLMPEQASAQAPLVDRFFSVMVTIATALFIVVEGAILLFVIKFRKRRGDETDGLPIEGNIPLEIFWTAIPAIIVIGLSVYSVQVFEEMGGFGPGAPVAMAHMHGMSAGMSHHGTLVAQAAETPVAGDVAPSIGDPAVPDAKYGVGRANEFGGSPPADVTVNVTGMQFAWLFNYPEENITAGELHVPIGKDVQINITAQDVIHAFWVPQFRIKQDAMPGLPSELRFTATKVGTYPIVCAELCGSYHGGMRSQVIVHTQEDYDRWLTENRIAQQANPQQTIAVNPANLSDSEFLAPYGHEMGITAETLAQLH